jgi:Ser/Thr protein kinase RdoA (MazF antagonist)
LLKDVDAITYHLEKNGFVTPRLIKTKDNKLGIVEKKDCWRMLTYIPGISYEKGISPKLAEQAAGLVGKFHDALSNVNYAFHHKIPDFHNTPAIMNRLRRVTQQFNASEKHKTLHPLADKILKVYERIDATPYSLPDRVIHGDLKISNVRFSKNGKEAISLLDLDTLGKDKIVIDLGDAVRSWCNSSEEGDVKGTTFNINIFEHMIRGYFQTANFITTDEKMKIPDGIELMTLELSARYITDAFEESYFTLDKLRYPSLYEQNKQKAIAQLQFYDDFQSKQNIVVQIIEKYA